jgi:hypothetical protein
LRAWSVPRDLLRDGANTIDIELAQGDPLTLSFVDLAVR